MLTFKIVSWPCYCTVFETILSNLSIVYIVMIKVKAPFLGKKVFVCLFLNTFLVGIHFQTLQAQASLYHNTFPLQDVVLTDGPFKHARDLNIEYLLKYDLDRLLAPFLKESGLPEKAKSFSNWEGLDGHVGGHYLSAMAINYAATGNAECKRRMDYMLSELKKCAAANDKRGEVWSRDYIGSVPNSKKIWSTFMEGDFAAYRSAWVPWYNVHKMYAGLRDVWIYTGNKDAKKLFLKFCDWSIHITSKLSDVQMEAMLDTEHGGMNEVLADAYQISGNQKYLTASKRFSHKMLLDAMASKVDNLDNKHANTQVPKAVGFQRIAENDTNEKFATAAEFFWHTVTNNRTLAFGGNSRREFFPSKNASTDFIDDVEGPESCNTYNMLKLTEDLFRAKPHAKYMDYYEKALYNHILSTQHPDHGGYVYFTPVRPQHYRVYSAPNEAMWCCVGSGMENHGKYNQVIYSHQNDNLYVNLFVASSLKWKEKGVMLQQKTNFPEEHKSTIHIEQAKKHFNLKVRIPEWVKGSEFKILINGVETNYDASPDHYATIQRKWKKADIVEVVLPMHYTLETMPNVPEYQAFMQGPILMGAKTSHEDLKGLVADDGRWAHIASGKRIALDEAPSIIANDQTKLIREISDNKLSSGAEVQLTHSKTLDLQPFYKIHDARYMVYWMVLNQNQYQSYMDSLKQLENEKIDIQNRTVDYIAPGEQQPEVDHGLQSEKSRKGNNHNEFWREAAGGGFFSYRMNTQKNKDLTLRVRYWGAEWGSRKFDIYIDDKLLKSENNTGRWNLSRFQEIEYPIPNDFINGKEEIVVKFQALPENTAGAVYYLRLLQNKDRN